MKTKKIAACFLLAMVVAASVWAFSEDGRQAIRLVVEDAVSDLSGVPKTEGILILPIRGDRNQFVEGQLKAALSRAGYNPLEPADQIVWNQILKEIEWDERKEDILDADTLLKFGKLQGARFVIYGSLLQVDQTAERVYAELAIHAASLSTRQHVWGGAFAQSFYLSTEIRGLVNFDQNAREVLAAVVGKIVESVQGAGDRPTRRRDGSVAGRP